MRIGLFARAFSPSIGGLERIAEILATEFTKKGHSVSVVTDTLTPHSQADESLPYSVVRTQTTRGRAAAFKDVDVILFFNLSLPGLAASWLAGKPAVMSHHGLYRGKGPLAVLLESAKRQLTFCFPNIAVSEFVARHVPGRSVVIGNAYDASLFVRDFTVGRERDFVFCGRLVPEKGGLVCLQAFKLAAACFPAATLTIVGSGTELDRLRGFALTSGISSQVVFAGPLSGAALVGEVRRHSCLVVPSLWEEPFGIVALEGIACCETVIAARRGGLPEALGGNGVLVEPDVRSLAAAMVSVLEAKSSGYPLPGASKDPDRAMHLAKHAPSIVAERYLEVIRGSID